MRREIKWALKRRDAGYSSSDSDESKSEWLLPTTGRNSGLFARSNNNKRNNNHIVSNSFSANKKAKPILSSTAIATVMANI